MEKLEWNEADAASLQVFLNKGTQWTLGFKRTTTYAGTNTLTKIGASRVGYAEQFFDTKTGPQSLGNGAPSTSPSPHPPYLFSSEKRSAFSSTSTSRMRLCVPYRQVSDLGSISHSRIIWIPSETSNCLMS